MRLSPLILAALVSLQVAAAPRWISQYFYDEDESSLTINDLRFSSAARGIAAGYIKSGNKLKPAELLTSDGGRTWTLLEPPEIPISLFTLNDDLAWMVSKDGIRRSTDGGKTWARIDSPKGVVRVYFTSPEAGIAVGEKKGAYQTSNGGKEWTRIAAADKPATNPENTLYHWIEFPSESRGIITGSSRPPRKMDSPFDDWTDPESAKNRRELPSTILFLQTVDGGKTWVPSQTSAFGSMTRVRTAPDGRGLGLIEFFNSFYYPGEVFRLDWKTGDMRRVFRQKDRAITDVMVIPNGPAYLAGVEVSGLLSQTIIPGKVKILRSSDLANWEEMEVDYRAVANRVMLASADGQIWAATDTGMILKLASE